MITLHYFPGTIAVATAIALIESGLPHTRRKVDFKQSEQTSADYLAINPKGRVPALDVDGTILTETGAILEFIAARAPDAGLAPTDPMDAARVRAVMYYLASTMHVNHAHKMRGHRWADTQSSYDDMAAKVPETMAASAVYVEENCLTGPFILGDQLTVADAYLFAIGNWLPGDGVDLAGYPKLSAFMDAMNARASVQTLRDERVIV